MNTLEPYITSSPFNKDEECAKFVIDNVADIFTLSDITAASHEYTFSFWIRSDAAGELIVQGTTFQSSTLWTRHRLTFTAASVDFSMEFAVAGTYYIYHPQLEIGNTKTDWSPAPEDFFTKTETEAAIQVETDKITSTVTETHSIATSTETRVTINESVIQQLADMIASLVTDGNGASLMTQTADGWTFNISEIVNTIDATASGLDDLTGDMGSVNSVLDTVKQSVNDLGVLTDYIVIKTYNGEPCIELGEGENNFKLRITNTKIEFADGTTIPAYLSNQKLYIEKAEVKDELQFGGFVWKVRSNGNMGLLWRGVSE